ncbi:hypothetical protein [Bacillus cereus]|uniref:hypothetical protein n=1 Tax=Bacillus cereus TaxID=1396 RepID=UPI0020D25273|nr:hypothetical protein [Bacillus cereus]
MAKLALILGMILTALTIIEKVKKLKTKRKRQPDVNANDFERKREAHLLSSIHIITTCQFVNNMKKTSNSSNILIIFVTLLYFAYFRDSVEASIFKTVLDIVLIILLVLYIINTSLRLYGIFKEKRGE